MSTFDIVLIVGISVSILLFILMMVSLVQFIISKKNVTALQNGKPKDRKKRRKWKREVRQAENQKSKKLRLTLFSFLAFLIFGGASGYAKYYQATTITDEDTENIVYAYYLLDQLEQQIKDIDGKSEKKASDNIHSIAVSLSSFASKKGSNQSVEEAQILLNQYYARVGQFGVNVSSQNFEALKKDKEKQAEYLDDIKVVRQTQKKVIDYYKIDESSLKEKK
ncbi:MAG: hypothetical protein RR554_11265 [Vagococcus sp.]|uniref:hypothetical protein n=1 Tax=Vagococcus sp. TaxID=1933889 RepID=UPI002FCAE405